MKSLILCIFLLVGCASEPPVNPPVNPPATLDSVWLRINEMQMTLERRLDNVDEMLSYHMNERLNKLVTERTAEAVAAYKKAEEAKLAQKKAEEKLADEKYKACVPFCKKETIKNSVQSSATVVVPPAKAAPVKKKPVPKPKTPPKESK